MHSGLLMGLCPIQGVSPILCPGLDSGSSVTTDQDNAVILNMNE